MERLLSISRWALPLGVAAASAALAAKHGGLTFPTGFAVVGGAALGWVLSLLLQSMAVLTGHTLPPPPPSDRRLRELERDKHILLRSIKEIEFDAALEKISEEEARRLTEPMRQRAVRILRELDEARVDDLAVDDIEAEVARRLIMQPKGR